MEEECSILKNNRCMTQMCLWNSREINVVGTVRNLEECGETSSAIIKSRVEVRRTGLEGL